jgi:hypothetical protein
LKKSRKTLEDLPKDNSLGSKEMKEQSGLTILPIKMKSQIILQD